MVWKLVSRREAGGDEGIHRQWKLANAMAFSIVSLSMLRAESVALTASWASFTNTKEAAIVGKNETTTITSTRTLKMNHRQHHGSGPPCNSAGQYIEVQLLRQAKT